MAIFFKDKSLSLEKNFLEGTHRCCSPEKTWEKILPFQKKIGVTRVANITGLDRIKIPVALSMRPLALTLSVSSGKGLTLASAYVSALMEAFELYSAENADLPIVRASFDEISQKNKVIPLSLLPLRKNSLFQPNWPERWVPGWDLMQKEEVMTPFSSVILNYKTQRSDFQDLFSFSSSSNGLASGNHFLEALSSAIYEAIERDSITCHLFASKSTCYYPPRIELNSIPYPRVQNLIQTLQSANVCPILYDCTTDTKVPVFMVTLYDKLQRHSGITHGYGAHLDPEIALIRAFTEAVQGRALIYAGSRDDNFSSRFDLFKKYDSNTEIEELEKTEGISYGATSETTPTFEEDIELLLRKLRNIGIEQVIVFDLTPEDAPVAAVRVVIPGLEGYLSQTYQPQKRALTFAKTRKNVPSMKPSLEGMHFPAGAQ